MKSIRFRAWCKSENKMFYDVQDTYDFGCSGCPVMAGSFKEVLENDDYEVMQFTGCKDKNGKEIYEGDIVTTRTFNGAGIGHVVFINGAFKVKYCGKGRWDHVETFYYDFNSYTNVLGNIYETPKLLKENEDG